MDSEAKLRPLVATALANFRKAHWDDALIAEAEKLWVSTHQAQAAEHKTRALADFKRALARHLARTSKPDDPPTDVQIDRVANWVAAYTENDATYNASWQNGAPEKMWVTRHDDKVRHAHALVDGQTKPIGASFDVGGSKLRYPGEPVGAVENWINCRCRLQQKGGDTTMTGKALAASGAPTGDEIKKMISVVALPAADHPVHQVAKNLPGGAHMSLAFMGDPTNMSDEDIQSIHDHVASVASMTPPVTDTVSGRGTLGPNGADVQLMNGDGTVPLRNKLIDDGPGPDGDPEPTPVGRGMQNAEQFPTFIPHVTLGYPGAEAAEDPNYDSITFDRLAVWNGDEQTEYPLGGTITAAGGTIDAETETPGDISETGSDNSGVEPDIDEMVEIPFHGVVAPIGKASNDGRFNLKAGGLSTRQLPIPFMFQESTMPGHDTAVPVGRIDWAQENPETMMIDYGGVFQPGNPNTEKAIAAIIFGSARSVSFDLGGAEVEPLSDADMEAMMNGADITPIFNSYQLAAVTMVPVGAFEDAYVALGECDCPDAADAGSTATEPHDEMGDETDALAASGAIEEMIAAPGTHDGPGWITTPIPTERIRRYWVHGEGAAKIKWGVPGDFNRCRSQLAKYILNPDWLAGACANMHKEALGVWPGQEDLGAAAAEMPVASVTMGMVASGSKLLDAPASWFKNPELEHLTNMTVEPDGRVYGHLASWNQCHVSITGQCTTAPPSNTDYAFFKAGLVDTDEGDIRVGHLTMGIGHIGLEASAAAATRHYDQTDSIVADVVMGEDVHGIWFAGALRDIGDDRRRELRAAGMVSGDWRRVSLPQGGQDLELIGAVVVAFPGFPVPAMGLAASGGHQDALVAAGLVFPDAVTAGGPLSPDQMLLIVDAVKADIEHSDRRKAKLAAIEDKKPMVRAAKIARAKRVEAHSGMRV
jgi:hypothetical protein